MPVEPRQAGWRKFQRREAWQPGCLKLSKISKVSKVSKVRKVRKVRKVSGLTK